MTRNCDVCGQAIPNPKPNQSRYCGPSCSRHARAERDRERHRRAQTQPIPRNLFGAAVDAPSANGGGILPGIRTHYPATVARALHELAESNPTPETYARERARILEANR